MPRDINISIVRVDAHAQPVPANISHRDNIRKVLLIQPPAFSNNLRGDMNPNAPLGIAYIAAVLERAGYEAKILDAFIEGWHTEQRITPEKMLVGLPFEEIKKIVASESPDVVGITSMFTSQRKNAYRVAELVKEIDSSITVLVGGAHPTSAPESVLAEASVDIAILGEGENTIIPLLRCIEKDGDLTEIDGIGYRDCNGQPVVQPKTSQIEDLDSIPFPARHLLPMEKYFAAGVRHGGYSKGKRSASMITSRGCQYKCNFCTAFKVFTRRPRMRSIENVLAEIEELVTRYGVDEVFFEDDQLVAKQRRTGDLFDAIAHRFNISWDTPNGVSPWLLTEDIITKMKNSGCYRINLAIESGVQDVLDSIINKPVKLEQIPGLVKLIRKYGIEVGIFLVVGNVGENRVETLDEIRKSFRFARLIRIIPHASILTAYPGSEVLEIAKRKKYLVPGFDWDNLIIQKPQLQTPEWSPEELKVLVEREMLKTRLWIWLVSPLQTIHVVGQHFIRDPKLTLIKVFRFLLHAVNSFVKPLLGGK
ncbi:MAG: B12-binding domain-containing radical SAM protein [Sulfuricella sp.]|nr:B12-binding domain-containing radical SAM protein [Sulfuricella sp.]